MLSSINLQKSIAEDGQKEISYMVGAKYILVHEDFILLSLEPAVNLLNPKKLRPYTK